MTKIKAYPNFGLIQKTLAGTISATTLLLTFFLVNPAVSDENRSVEDDDDKEGIRFFEKEIRPILKDQCYECHDANKQESGLRLDHISKVKEGGDTGPAIDEDDWENSLLLRAIGYDDEDLSMPPRGKMEEEQIEAIRKWVEMGTPWPKEPIPEED